jgi:tRNA-specific adenosine deaminase 2
MERALELGEEALRQGEVPVGCLFLYKGKVIAEGRNTVNETKNATRHAEMDCIDRVLGVCETVEWTGVSVVVSVEPCAMCAAALLHLGVANIVYGCGNDRFGGCGSVVDVPSLYSAQTTIRGGLKAERAMALLKEFYQGVNPNAPPDKVKIRKK